MEIFISTNCLYFVNINIPQASSKSRNLSDSELQEYYSFQQYSIWKKFQEKVEQILKTFLENLGGNIQTLKTALHVISSQPM